MAEQSRAVVAGLAAESELDRTLASERFDEIAATHLGDPAIARTKMCGMPVLKVGGRLVFKLPLGQIEALLATGDAEPFRPMAGRTMREWVAVRADARVNWLEIARSARSFVAGE